MLKRKREVRAKKTGGVKKIKEVQTPSAVDKKKGKEGTKYRLSRLVEKGKLDSGNRGRGQARRRARLQDSGEEETASPDESAARRGLPSASFHAGVRKMGGLRRRQAALPSS